MDPVEVEIVEIEPTDSSGAGSRLPQQHDEDMAPTSGLDTFEILEELDSAFRFQRRIRHAPTVLIRPWHELLVELRVYRVDVHSEPEAATERRELRFESDQPDPIATVTLALTSPRPVLVEVNFVQFGQIRDLSSSHNCKNALSQCFSARRVDFACSSQLRCETFPLHRAVGGIHSKLVAG